jgi:hypothetical protein
MEVPMRACALRLLADKWDSRSELGSSRVKLFYTPVWKMLEE